jgi:hypothetical protein
MRQQKPKAKLTVPDVFQHRFATRAEYDAWVEERRKLYFG